MRVANRMSPNCFADFFLPRGLRIFSFIATADLYNYFRTFSRRISLPINLFITIRNFDFQGQKGGNIKEFHAGIKNCKENIVFLAQCVHVFNKNLGVDKTRDTGSIYLPNLPNLTPLTISKLPLPHSPLRKRFSL